MKKINVIGTTGSGKSTFSQCLARKLGHPYVQMDQLFWKPKWEESTDDEFFPKLIQAISGEAWVLDGNYNRTNSIKWQHADTIIWLDYSYPRTFFQLLKRTLSRAISKSELWPGTSNRESFGKSFLSKDSIFIWFFKYYRKNKVRYADLIRSPDISHIKFIRLRSPGEAKRFIDSMDAQ